MSLTREFENQGGACPHGGKYDTCIDCSELLLRIAQARKCKVVPICIHNSEQCSKVIQPQQYKIVAGIGETEMVLCSLHQKLLQQKNPHWKFYSKEFIQ